jgi:DNA invertase Pin-like site-specific DNA recombinase
MLNMLATLAEYERESIVERVNAGIAAAADRPGFWSFRILR